MALEEGSMLWEADNERKPWETEGDLPWLEREPLPWEQDEECDWAETETGEEDGWRGTSHLADWPEDLAGPEYWLYKRMSERES
jgi:hypothetical protein